MSQIKDFIEQLAAGDNVAAKESINNALSTKAFESLDAFKKEIASTLFNNGQEKVEVQDTADTPIEDEETVTQEEVEQIDELSNETLKSYAGKVVDKTRTMPQGAKKQKHLAGFGKAMDKMQGRLHRDLDRMP
jgi:hypothetical protein